MRTFPHRVGAVAVVFALVASACATSNGPQSGASAAPSAPALLARGTFKAKGANVELDATGAGSEVSGRMVVTDESWSFTVDTECERHTDDGLVWIGGDVSESTFTEYAPKGSRTAIVLKQGSPAQAVFVFQMDDPRSASCQAFFDDMLRLGPVAGGLEPIEGTVELAP